MTKKLIILFLITLIPSLSIADAIKYRSDIKPKHYNDVWKKFTPAGMRVDYDPENDSFDFYIKESLYIVGFSLTRSQADALVASIEKYKKWNIKASNKKVTVDKEITKILTDGSFWKIGNGDWNFGYSVDIAIHFFSQTTQKHQLIFFVPKLQSKYNKYVTHNPETTYFDYDEAMKLKKALAKEAVDQFVVKAKKQAKIEAEFN